MSTVIDSTDVDIDNLIAETNEAIKLDDNTNDLNFEKSQTPEPILDSNATSNNKENIEIDAKQKKKLEKFTEHLFKKSGLSQLSTLEEKFYALANKYSEIIEQNKTKENSYKELQKNFTLITKQRDQLQHDHSKALLARNKLESLCRELQRHNKAIKEENLNRTKEEEEKRKEISNKFQAAIDEINQQVNSNTERNNTLIQENVQLASKLKTLLDQYDAREQHMEKVLKHKDLENQLMVAKFQQSELRVAELTERNKQCDELITELTKKCEHHAKAEEQLKAQLKVYTEKYEEFQNTLSKSNEVFGSFKTEMDKMTKKIKKLEQETLSWKKLCEDTNKKLLRVDEQKEVVEKEAKRQQLRADTLEQLSRTLQTERSNLIQKLKQYEDVANKEANTNAVEQTTSQGDAAKEEETLKNNEAENSEQASSTTPIDDNKPAAPVAEAQSLIETTSS